MGGKNSFYIAAIDDKANRVFLSVYIGNPYTSFVLIQFTTSRDIEYKCFIFRARCSFWRGQTGWEMAA